MVYDNHKIQDVALGDYGNAAWRARHGYKEADTHDPPQRMNYDFKPIPYGTARGIPNYRHSEPFFLLKNLRDL